MNTFIEFLYMCTYTIQYGMCLMLIFYLFKINDSYNKKNFTFLL